MSRPLGAFLPDRPGGRAARLRRRPLQQVVEVDQPSVDDAVWLPDGEICYHYTGSDGSGLA